jgi:phenylalanyl-tRNA synthetase beta chain
MEVARDEQVRILTSLGFSASGTGDVLEVWVPSWRPDVHGEADLVEEVARVASLTKLASQPLPRAAGVGRKTLTPMQTRERDARRTLAALGLNECVTYSFIAEEHASLFGGGGDEMRLDNPISSEMSHMRPSALPGLLAAAARNQAQGAMDVALFEVGAGYSGPEPGEQATTASAIRVGTTGPRHWADTRRPSDMMDAKADAEAVLAALGAPVDKLMVMREAPDWFHPGRSAALKLGPKNTLAVFGELHPKVLRAMDIKGTGVAVTVMLENIPMPKSRGATRPALVQSNLQPVDRDFAFVVDSEVEAEQIRRAAKGADKKLITGVDVFDVFDGPKAAEQLGQGKKSVAISVRLQPVDATLTDQQIEAIGALIVDTVASATGATLRG